MQRTRISSVIFDAPESAPGSSVNGNAAVLHVESASLRLECDEIGVIATALDKGGKLAKIDNNPVRYPWARVRKVTGERAAEVKPVKEAAAS